MCVLHLRTLEISDWSLIVALQGVMSGIVGGFGNLGGLIFALIFKFQTATGKAFWIIGAMSIAINLLLFVIPVPRY
jgi:NNP family nitrate/nitrite transporter-like MFS transporter